MSELHWTDEQKKIVSRSVEEDMARHLRHQEILDNNILSAVWRGRRAGMSWAQLGRAVGVTKQAAQQRYGVVAIAGARSVLTA